MRGTHPGRLAQALWWIDLTAFAAILITMLGKVPGLPFYLQSYNHGYQLSVGRQIGFGKVPGVDLIFHYGPLTAYTSALNFLVADSLIVETIICASGYSLAVFLIYRFVRRYALAHAGAGILAGAAAAIIAIENCARFYKWYYWLFPLLVMYGLSRACAGPPNGSGRVRWLAGCGFAAGVGALYRFDLGIAGIGSITLAVILIEWRAAPVARLAGELACALGAFAAPVAVWLSVLVFAAGGRYQDYFGVYFDGARAELGYWGFALPTFDPMMPFSNQSALAMCLGITLATYFAVLLCAAWRVVSGSGEWSQRGRFMVIAASIGVGLIPQALHNPSLPHFIQIFPPMLILGLCGGAWLFSRAHTLAPLKPGISVAASSMATGYILAGMACLTGLWGNPSYDLEPFGLDITRRYEHLYGGLPSYPYHPMANLVSLVRARSAEDQSILLLGTIATGHFLGRRHASIFPYYMWKLYASPGWRARDMEAILKDPPELVVTPRAPKGHVRASIDDFPEVREYVEQRFRVDPALQDPNGPWLVLTRRADGSKLTDEESALLPWNVPMADEPVEVEAP